jgi:hypothetical protein
LMCFAYSSAGQVCAANYAELGRTERLRTVQALFQGGAWLGLINETKGSYVTIVPQNEKMIMTLFTSGLFDLFPVQRQSPVMFCDDGYALEIRALGRNESLAVLSGKLIVGGGGARRTFSVGAMPDFLRRLHHLDARGIASD